MPELHAPGWIAGFVAQGLSASAGLRAFRDAGGAMRDSVWYRLYAEQQATFNAIGDEITKPLNVAPTASEILPMTTKRKEGYLQIVEIYTRLTGTDVVVTRPFMFPTDTLMTRGDAVTKALSLAQTAIDQERYEETLIGGVYTGTRLMKVGDTA